MNEEIIIINDEPFYRIPNGTSYDYAPIPKEFKPYFERLQQEKQQLKDNWKKLKTMIQTSIIATEETAKKPDSEFITTIKGTFGRVLNMMQELEGNNE